MGKFCIKGYSINQNLLKNKQEQIKEIQKTLAFLVKSCETLNVSDPFFDILKKYTNSLITLNQFDENRLDIQQGHHGVQVEISEFRDLITKTFY